MPFYVYILLMKDSRLYVGHSNNPPRRHSEHESGKGCRTTGIFGAGDMIYVEEYPDRASAARRERQIKGWTRAKKLAFLLFTDKLLYIDFTTNLQRRLTEHFQALPHHEARSPNGAGLPK
jgi:putative endonuclease